MSPETPAASTSAAETSTHDDGSETSGAMDESDDDGGGRLGTERRVTYLTWVAVAVLAVTALVALFGFYTGVSRVITVWVSRPYQPVVNAAFNLALLLAALGGIGLLLRRRD